MLKDLLQRAFDGSARKLLVRLVEDGGVTPKELDDLAKFIHSVRKNKRSEI
jgi:predicted transcriptional regulator